VKLCAPRPSHKNGWHSKATARRAERVCRRKRLCAERGARLEWARFRRRAARLCTATARIRAMLFCRARSCSAAHGDAPSRVSLRHKGAPCAIRADERQPARRCTPARMRARTRSLQHDAMLLIAIRQATLRDVPPTYRALWGDKVGNSFRDVAVVKELPILEPKAGEVLIQVW